MLRTSALSVCLVALAFVAASAVHAASVKLTLIKDPTAIGCDGCSLSGAGTYQLFAEASAGDNNGIAGYGISVQGVSSFLHRAPRVNSSETPDGDIFPAGFTLLRSGNNQVPTGTGFLIGAGQDTVTPTPYLVQGLGQTAGNFEALLPPGNTNGGIIQPTWESRLLLGEGMYSGAEPDVDLTNVDVFVNLFATTGGGVERAATMEKLLCVGVCGDLVLPMVNDLALSNPPANLNATVGGTVTGTDVATWDPTLEFVSYTPNYGAPNDPSFLPALTATWNAGTQAFSWDTTGSRRGDYVWRVTGSNNEGSDTGLISVAQQAVPEPATLSLLGLALAGFVGAARRRS